MAHTLLFHDWERGIVELRRYSDEGRLMSIEEHHAIQVELRRPAVIHRGMSSGIILYSLEGDVVVEVRGSRVVVR